MSGWRGGGENIVVSFGLHNKVMKERKWKIYHKLLQFNGAVPINPPLSFGPLVSVAHFSSSRPGERHSTRSYQPYDWKFLHLNEIIIHRKFMLLLNL
ncbi:hypothetical protein BM1_03039 [Bipolaris maydis]|nr:hypothetical protein BM1_03039 [Bipolaris maydis]